MSAEKTICRICLSSRDKILHRLFDNNSHNMHFKLMSCAKIQILPNDGMPQSICSLCADKLETSFEFRKLCESSDARLRIASDKMYQSNEAFEIHGAFVKDLTIFGGSDTALARVSIDNVKNDVPEKSIKTNRANNQCETCGKVFKRREKLIIHIRTHTGEKPFVCDVCGKAFRVRHHLQSHHRVHTSEQPYQCLHCGKCFNENSSLSRHTKIHTNDKKFCCSYCPKRFISLNDVRKHSVTHSGDRPFQCKTCQRRFSDAGTLSKHKKTHKNLTACKQNIIDLIREDVPT